MASHRTVPSVTPCQRRLHMHGGGARRRPPLHRLLKQFDVDEKRARAAGGVRGIHLNAHATH
jgi:hypothetical protein